jgi:hypothetical protein
MKDKQWKTSRIDSLEGWTQLPTRRLVRDDKKYEGYGVFPNLRDNAHTETWRNEITLMKPPTSPPTRFDGERLLKDAKRNPIESGTGPRDAATASRTTAATIPPGAMTTMAVAMTIRAQAVAELHHHDREHDVRHAGRSAPLRRVEPRRPCP